LSVGLPRNIIVAIDGSEPSFKALDYALQLAKAGGSDVIGLHAILLPSYAAPKTLDILRNELSNKAAAFMDRARKAAESNGLRFREKIVTTDRSVVLAIVEQAGTEKADLVVIGTRGTTGFPKLMLGSVAAGVVNMAPCPVLAVR